MRSSRLIAILILAVLGLFLTVQVAGAAPAKVLKVWVQADAVRYPGFEAVTKKFEDSYPGVKVELTNVPGGWSDLYRKLLAAFVGRTEPDVLYGKGYWVVDFASRGMLLDLTKYWERDKQKELNASPVFFRHVEEGSSYKGKIYGLPRGEYWYALGYNVDMFKAAGLPGPPDTWDELRQYAIKLTNKQKKTYGFALATYTRVDPVFVESVLDTWTRQNGGSIMDFDKDGDPVYKLAGNSKAHEALQFILDNLYQSGGFLPPELEGSMESMIHSNQVGMWWTHGGHISRYRRAAPNLNFNVAVMPKKVYRSTYIADNKFMVSARTRMPDEAWEYIKFFTTKDSEALFAPYEGHISVWKDNWDLPVYEHPGYKGLMKQLLLDDTLPYRTHPGWEPTRSSIAREIQKVLFRKVSIDEGLKAAQAAAEQALAQVRK